MQRKFLILILLGFLTFVCAACTPKHPDMTPELKKQFNNDFKLGRVNLDCEISCSWSWIRSFNEMINMHNSNQWEKLAQKVMQIGRRIDIAYYFLGRSAEGLGYNEAALVFYRQSLILYDDPNGSYHCRNTNNCGGVSLPDIIPQRIAIVQGILNPNTKIAAERTNPDSTHTLKAEIENKPLSNEENLELKTILHAKNVCEMCSWPMPERTKQEIKKYEDYYKKRTEGLNDPLLPGMDMPLFQMADSFAKGTINRPGLVVYCTDNNERKRYEEIIKSIKPFSYKNPVVASAPISSNSAVSVGKDKSSGSKPYVKVDLSHIKKWAEQKLNFFDRVDGIQMMDDKNFRKALKATIGKKRYDLFTSEKVRNYRYFQSSGAVEQYGDLLYFYAHNNNNTEEGFYAAFFLNPDIGFIDVIWGDTIVDKNKYKLVIDGKVISENIVKSDLKFKMMRHDGTQTDIDLKKYGESDAAGNDYKAVYNDYK